MRRVLSVQSHVVHGYVGNKAATFPLQVLGINVDCINTVTLSNRPDYTNKCKGFRLEPGQFTNIIDGLNANGLLDYNAILSGYISSAEIIECLRVALEDTKAIYPHMCYICDPVLGDDGNFYVPKELLHEYLTKLLPLATIITPNYFEAQQLSGVEFTSFTSAVDACSALHAIGPRVCILKGLPLNDLPANQLAVIISSKLHSGNLRIYRINFEKLSGKYSGCGDLFTALVTGWILRDPLMNLGEILEIVTSVMSRVIQLTKDTNSAELRIVEAIDIYRTEPILTNTYKSFVAYDRSCAGVIFDLDGTLTLPGAIDFIALYSRLNLFNDDSTNYDIVGTVNKLENEAERNEKWQIIDDEELKAEARMELQPDVHAALNLLRKHRIRLSIATRNTLSGVKAFIQKAQLESDIFYPVISRNCLDGVNKPDPAVAMHIANQWKARCEQVWFVGDSFDDMRCGKGAGMKTCLVINPTNAHLVDSQAEYIDLAVHNLMDFVHFLNLDEE